MGVKKTISINKKKTKKKSLSASEIIQKRETELNQIFTALKNELDNGLSWSAGFQKMWAINGFTGKPYMGYNAVRLLLAKYEKPIFLTLNQTNTCGGRVKKGEHGIHLVRLQSNKIKDEKNNIEKTLIEDCEKNELKKTYNSLIGFVVFNISQLEGVNLKYDLKTYEHSLIDTCEKFLNDISKKIVFKTIEWKHGHITDSEIIGLPAKKQYEDIERYYCTAFHEIIHWTGFPKQLNRNISFNSSTKEYAFEELVAEIGSMMLATRFGIAEKHIKNAGAYLTNWMGDNFDSKIFANAFKQADDAVRYLEKIVNIPEPYLIIHNEE